jgi:hypothetical protein
MLSVGFVRRQGARLAGKFLQILSYLDNIDIAIAYDYALNC